MYTSGSTFEEAVPNDIGFDERKSLFIGILRFLSFLLIPRTADFDDWQELRKLWKFVPFLVCTEALRVKTSTATYAIVALTL